MHTVAFSPDGKRIVTASDDNAVTVWDADKGAPLRTIDRQFDHFIRRVDFSPGGKPERLRVLRHRLVVALLRGVGRPEQGVGAGVVRVH
jgi:hypothetical protein